MWHFRKKAPDEKIRNPIQGEFFAHDAIAGPAQALVRESVQNSLDARNKGPVRVRFTLATGADALRPNTLAGLFEGAWPHIAAKGNGLLPDRPTPDSDCPYLLVEDYGTRGLTGDPTQCNPDEDATVKNPFFLFFRAEGLSAKAGSELGRWGVGKFVFPRSSQASTHFAVTIRHDDRRRYLLGSATLKGHRIHGDPDFYTPDGMYGKLGKNGLVNPIEDPTAIERFCRIFGLNRSTEPGLSVVVPFIDPSEFTFDDLLIAAVKDYFVPILAGDLEISICDRTRSLRITKDSIDQVIDSNQGLSGSILPLIQLFRSLRKVDQSERIELDMPDPGRSTKWTDDLVSPETLKLIRRKLSLRDAMAIRVPLTIREKGQDPKKSYFDIYLKPDKTSNGRPVFLREGIIISDVKAKRAREYRALVVIEDKPLAGMLGDSENPAHTQWQRDGSNFKGKYTYGKSVIDFVSDSVGELIGIVNRSNEEADASLTIDYFSIRPLADDDEAPETPFKKAKSKPGDTPTTDSVTLEKKPTKLQIRRGPGGFTVAPGSDPPPTPYDISIQCAYETRIGNALRKWDPADFKLGSKEIPIAYDGSITILTAVGNTVVLRAFGSDYHVRIDGFDTNRDLYVRAVIKESSDDSAEV